MKHNSFFGRISPLGLFLVQVTEYLLNHRIRGMVSIKPGNSLAINKPEPSQVPVSDTFFACSGDPREPGALTRAWRSFPVVVTEGGLVILLSRSSYFHTTGD
jgi:hypothetical protein